jgi:hypothetical protein
MKILRDKALGASNKLRLGSVAVAALLLGSCANMTPEETRALQCAGGGLLAGLIASQVFDADTGTAAGVGAAVGVGCYAIFSVLQSERDREAYLEQQQAALDKGEPTNVSYTAADAGVPVSINTGAEETVQSTVLVKATPELTGGVPAGFIVVGRPYRTTASLNLRAAPSTGGDNVIGGFRSGEVVNVMGLTADRQWALIGANDVAVGYSSLQYLRPDNGAPRAAARGGVRRVVTATPTARNGGQMRTAEPRTIRVAATTQCRSVQSQSGTAVDRRRGCRSPDGGWAVA